VTTPGPRPDQRLIGTSVAGVGPAPSTAVIVGRVVIVFGPAGAVGGLFIYQPGTTPALGNPPIASITSATSDPFGNVIPAGFTLRDFTIQTETSGQVRFKVDQFGNILVFNPAGALIYLLAPSGDGYFLYEDTGSATQGGLSISNVVTAGTDQFGNPYVAGLASYVTIAGTLNAVQMNNGVFNFLTYDSVGLAWVNDTELFSTGSGFLRYTSVSGGSSPGDGNTYGVGALTTALSGGAVTSTGTTPIPVLTVNVAPGKYNVRGVVFGQQGAVAVTQNLAFQGTATRTNTSLATKASQTGTAANAFDQVVNTGSSTTVTAAIPINAGVNVWFMGFIVVSVGGTFTLSIADGTAGDHWKANNNSFMILEPTN
jgi:hypothetical protein